MANSSRKRSNRRVKRESGIDGSRSSVVAAPVSGSAIFRHRVPRLLNTREGVILSNTERFSVLNLASLGATTSSRVDVVPPSFPWLNGVAVNYSKYRWIAVQMYYIPIAPTNTNGLMAMGYVYDVNDGIGGNSVALTQQLYKSVSGPVWAGYEGASGLNSDSLRVPMGAIAMTLDTGKLEKPYYKYSTTAQISAMSGPEASMYIPASVIWATDSSPVSTTAGLIMAKYTVELLEPVPSVLND